MRNCTFSNEDEYPHRIFASDEPRILVDDSDEQPHAALNTPRDDDSQYSPYNGSQMDSQAEETGAYDPDRCPNKRAHDSSESSDHESHPPGDGAPLSDGGDDDHEGEEAADQTASDSDNPASTDNKSGDAHTQEGTSSQATISDDGEKVFTPLSVVYAFVGGAPVEGKRR